MKINCDYCGAQIDTDKSDTCPNCGGIYSHDPEVLAEKAKLARADELFIEQKQLENDRLRLENTQLDNANKNRAASASCLGIAVILGAIGLIFFMLMVLAILEGEDDSGTRKAGSRNLPVSTSQAVRTEEPEVAETKRISISYTISLDPINIPEIPEISIPDISVG